MQRDFPSFSTARSMLGRLITAKSILHLGLITSLLGLVAICGCGRFAYRLDSRVPEQFVPNPLDLLPGCQRYPTRTWW